MRRLVAPLLALMLAVGATAVPTISAQASAIPAFDHVFVIVMENHSYGEVIGSPSAPYVNSLTTLGGVAANYHAITHPSLPNYLTLTGASSFGISSDCAPSTCPVNAPNIADRVEAAGKSRYCPIRPS